MALALPETVLVLARLGLVLPRTALVLARLGLVLPRTALALAVPAGIPRIPERSLGRGL